MVFISVQYLVIISYIFQPVIGITGFLTLILIMIQCIGSMVNNINVNVCLSVFVSASESVL